MRKRDKIKTNQRERRKARVRAKIFGTSQQPRLSVKRSLKHIYAQLIDDTLGRTLVSVSDREIKGLVKNKEKEMGLKIKTASAVGKLLAEKALAKKIKQCVFDKSYYKYHGRLKALAEGAREGGLKF